MRCSSSQISPSLAGTNPAMIPRAVDFPQPLGPKKVTNSRPRMFKTKLSRTVLPPKRLVMDTCSRSIESFISPCRYVMRGESLSEPGSRACRSQLSLPLELIGADFAIPTIHRVGGLFHRQCRLHGPFDADLIIIGAPEFLDLVLNFLRCFVERRRLDRGPDEGRPSQRLLIRTAHEFHEIENYVHLLPRNADWDTPIMSIDDECR